LAIGSPTSFLNSPSHRGEAIQDRFEPGHAHPTLGPSRATGRADFIQPAWVKIPLTVFAFAGGALAIALGFGMQTLLKNFVCGIIILFERPFRVGDVLDVAGQKGVVTGIGTRSSVLQQWDGTETLIPNSALLENSVTNWTYTNRKVRFIISVGVAYGSDIRRVVQILTEVVERHGIVEKSPQPQILLVDFAASALTFEIRFWVDVVKGNSAQISSDLRQMIAGALAENGIVIAFPQQEIHFDSKSRCRFVLLKLRHKMAIHPATQLATTNNQNAKRPKSCRNTTCAFNEPARF
jgi:small-conductance mechanosensitive channel